MLIGSTGISLIRGKMKPLEKVHGGRSRSTKGKNLNGMGWKVTTGHLLRHLRNITRKISGDKYFNYWVFFRSESLSDSALSSPSENKRAASIV